MVNNQILNREERLKEYNKVQNAWGKRKLLDVNSLPFDEVYADQ
jgi:hypothetical protein